MNRKLALTTTRTTLELATLRTDVGLRMTAGNARGTKVLDGLARVLRATHEHSVGTSGSLDGKLIEGQDLTTGLDDTGTGTLGDTKRTNSDLRHSQQTDVVGDSTNNHGNLVLLLLKELRHTSQRQGRSVNATHAQSLQNDAVELRAGTASQETVQLHQKLDVHIVRLRSRTVVVFLVVATTACSTPSFSSFVVQ